MKEARGEWKAVLPIPVSLLFAGALVLAAAGHTASGQSATDQDQGLFTTAAEPGHSPGGTGDLLDMYRLALANDRRFSAAGNEFEAVKQTVRQAKGLYYPTLGVAAERIETSQEIIRSDNDVFGSGESDFPTNVLSLSLSQPLFRWDYVSQRRRAGAEVQQAEYQFIAAEQELMLRTAEAYLLTLAALDSEFVTRQELDAVGRQLELARKRLEVGMANGTEVHESQARYDLTQSEVIQAQNALADRQEGLRVITGAIPGSLAPLRDDFDMVPPDPAEPEQWIDQALQNNLAVKARQAAVDVAMAEYRIDKADRYPTLDMVATFENRDTEGSLFGGGSEVESADISVRAGWTIFQGGTLRARIRESMYKLQQAEDELELERHNVRRATRNAYLGVVSSISRANALKSSRDAQAMTVQAKQRGFETGTNSNLEVLDAERDLYFVQRDYLEARYDYLLNLLNLKRQVGSLGAQDLAMINDLLATGQ